MSDLIKQAIRQTCLDVRQQLSNDTQQRLSRKICNHIRSMEEYRHSKRIALYNAINREVDLSALWHTAPLHGKYCYFPAIEANDTLAFLPATPATHFSKNQYGISEPDVSSEHAISPDTLDIMLTPLVAFDGYGSRIGMGKGYYDRTLAAMRPKLFLGVAYEFQFYPFIDSQPWDVYLDAIVTEKKIYWSKV